jgi:hypothetical protein
MKTNKEICHICKKAVEDFTFYPETEHFYCDDCIGEAGRNVFEENGKYLNAKAEDLAIIQELLYVASEELKKGFFYSYGTRRYFFIEDNDETDFSAHAISGVSEEGFRDYVSHYGIQLCPSKLSLDSIKKRYLRVAQRIDKANAKEE